jgi:two-component system chemotaxis sensor kinase CheA
MEIKAEYLSIFNEEANDQLREWEECLLALDRDPGQREGLDAMFRAIHTLKGSAGFIGFDSLQKLAHDLESSLAEVRDGSRIYDARLGEILFEGLDLCKSLIGSFTTGTDFHGDTEALLERLKTIGKGALPASKPTEAALAVETSAGNDPSTACRLEVRIEGEPHEAYLRSFLVKARLERLGRIIAVEPSPDVLRDGAGPFTYVVTIESGRGPEALATEVAIDQVTVSPHSAKMPVPSVREPTAPVTAKEPGRDMTGVQTGEVVRVSVQKLDTLLNLVGELVICNSGFATIARSLRLDFGGNPLISELEEKTEDLSAITRQLQNGIMKARMLPVANVFDRFRRVVRDLSKASGKAVALEVSGEETEIDKKVIDRLGEPLVHLVRNAVDHGLETSEERSALGKGAQGTIRLAAYQEGDHICIQVSDDGRGLDREAILKKALERGLISAEEAGTASAERILGFIFLPGFSTAQTVTEISGRGVGMDAVKRAVEEMSGNLRVQSIPGKGTTVTITLPLTMAIITAVLVEASHSTYAVPLSVVREILNEKDSTLRTVGTRRVIMLRDEVLSLVDLTAALRGDESAGHSAGTLRPVVIVDFEGRKIGLEVEKIVGTREVVIKSLSRHYREVEGLIGASILGNGTIALIVDVESLVVRHFHGSNGRRQVAKVIDALTEVSTVPTLPSVRPAVPLFSGESREETGQPVDELAAAVAGSKGLALAELHNAAAIHASINLSQLMGREIRVSFPESRLVPLKDVAELIGGEEATVGGIYVGVGGDITGGVLLVFPEKNLLTIDDILHRRPSPTITELAELDLSGLSELGNILASCFINSVPDSARLKVGPEVPEISVDMCLPVIDSVLARFNQPGEKILLTEAVIYGSDLGNVVCHQLLFLELDSLRRLMDTLTARVPAALARAQG